MKNSRAVPRTTLLHLSNRIRQARIRAELTKTELARRVGVCLSAVVQWEHPEGTAPSARNLARVAEVTEFAFEWLATGRGPLRVATDDGPPAIDPATIASTLFEERLLEVARRLPSDSHEPLLELLSAWTRKRR